MTNLHSFHIPVMGLAFSIDTPLKVSQFGIDSVISLADDILIEKMREIYCRKFQLPYQEIQRKTADARAKRITSYLNLINELSEKKFEEFKDAAARKSNEIREFFNLLPDNSDTKKDFEDLTSKHTDLREIGNRIKKYLSMGSIDVNIMTKLDKENYSGNEKLPAEYNDAHAALRGYANSNLKSSIIFSAGMNPRLYSYLENFKDFFPNRSGEIKKKITLKVSDYRSALIQGKFLAKKGLWVSEYRIESGLNCGGHAFATDGYLMGPILKEFRDKRKELIHTLKDIFTRALTDKNMTVPEKELPLKVTAQGGVGTAEEHRFLMDHYKVDSVGWGTPFLLVPEATTVDDITMDKLAKAGEEDLYLSDVSPLGVPFNNLRGNTKDLEKMEFIRKGKPGSPCPKGFLSFNKEFTEKPICTASRQYQNKKIKELNEEELSSGEYEKRFEDITVKSCLCVGLANSAILKNNTEHESREKGVLVCPGPNMAYFSRIMSLKEMTDHIYGRINVITKSGRPNIFIKELTMYIDYLQKKIAEKRASISLKEKKYLSEFVKNLNEGTDYYIQLFTNLKGAFESTKSNILNSLDNSTEKLQLLRAEIEQLPVREKI